MDESKTWFDYERQAWVKNGRYVRCGHRAACACYGRLHEGEIANRAASRVVIYVDGVPMATANTDSDTRQAAERYRRMYRPEGRVTAERVL